MLGFCLFVYNYIKTKHWKPVTCLSAPPFMDHHSRSSVSVSHCPNIAPCHTNPLHVLLQYIYECSLWPSSSLFLSGISIFAVLGNHNMFSSTSCLLAVVSKPYIVGLTSILYFFPFTFVAVFLS